MRARMQQRWYVCEPTENKCNVDATDGVNCIIMNYMAAGNSQLSTIYSCHLCGHSNFTPEDQIYDDAMIYPYYWSSLKSEPHQPKIPKISAIYHSYEKNICHFTVRPNTKCMTGGFRSKEGIKTPTSQHFGRRGGRTLPVCLLRAPRWLSFPSPPWPSLLLYLGHGMDHDATRVPISSTVQRCIQIQLLRESQTAAAVS